MASLFTQKCDICSSIQTEEDPHKIKGTAVVMNGVAKFACGDCRKLMEVAFSVGAEGLRDPLLALSKLTDERNQLKRLLEQANMQRETGNASLVGVEADHLVAQKFNALGMNTRFQPAGQLEHQPTTTKQALGYKGQKKSAKKK